MFKSKKDKQLAKNLEALKRNVLLGKYDRCVDIPEIMTVFNENIKVEAGRLPKQPETKLGKAKGNLLNFRRTRNVLNAITDAKPYYPSEEDQEKLTRVFNYLNDGVNVQFKGEEARLMGKVAKVKAVQASI